MVCKIILLMAVLACSVQAKDKYPNYAALAASEREGVDYRVLALDRASPILVMAVHGGWIEPGTSLLASELAGAERNLYLFEGIKPRGGNLQLHITSARFDEPRALALARRSALCVSFHGYPNEEVNNVCIGGENRRARAEIFRKLQATGLIQQNEQNPCQRFSGLGPRNIVNQCSSGGVQIEVSSRLRKIMMREPETRARFIRAIDESLGNIGF